MLKPFKIYEQDSCDTSSLQGSSVLMLLAWVMAGKPLSAHSLCFLLLLLLFIFYHIFHELQKRKKCRALSSHHHSSSLSINPHCLFIWWINANNKGGTGGGGHTLRKCPFKKAALYTSFLIVIAISWHTFLGSYSLLWIYPQCRAYSIKPVNALFAWATFFMWLDWNSPA